MFTGIIEACVTVRAVHNRDGNRRVTFALPRTWKLKKGESVNCDGICSTVIAVTQTTFQVEYMPTTLRITNSAFFMPGVRVNLERSLRFGDRVSGHFISGHCDGLAHVRSSKKDGNSLLLTLTHAQAQQHLIILRGSIALNGVSLTIAHKKNSSTFSVALIPETCRRTNLGNYMVDDTLNIEYDLITKIISEQKK